MIKKYTCSECGKVEEIDIGGNTINSPFLCESCRLKNIKNENK